MRRGRKVRSQNYLFSEPDFFLEILFKKIKFVNEFKRSERDMEDIEPFLEKFLNGLYRHFEKKNGLFFFRKSLIENIKNIPFLKSNESFSQNLLSSNKKIYLKEKKKKKNSNYNLLLDSLEKTKNEIQRSKDINSKIRYSVISFENIQVLNKKFLDQANSLSELVKKGKYKMVNISKFYIVLNLFLIFLGHHMISRLKN